MPDIVDQETRSRMMSGIRGKDTRPEHLVRRGLHARGLRFRLHARDVPGKPDLVFPKYRAVIFVNGCYWHGHDCNLFRLPGTRTEFWAQKIGRNRARDFEVRRLLDEAGWRHLTVWECALRGPGRLGADQVIDAAEDWLRHGSDRAELRGAQSGEAA